MIVRELLTRIGYQVDKRTEKEVKKSFEGVQNRARDMARNVVGFLSFGAIALGFKKAVDAASDVDETLNVVNTLFEDQTDVVLQWAKQFGDAAGRSQFAMREYAAQVGQVVAASLDNAEATAEMSTNIAEATVDLASFNNETEANTLAALRAGLVGSFEPLQRFGVVLNVAELEAFALRKGLKKTFKEMSAGEKITVRYQAIMEQAGVKMGDATRTAAGFANQTKRLQGNIRDLAVGIGQQFMPGFAEMLADFNAFAKFNIPRVIKAVSAVGNAFRALGLILKNFVEFFMQSGRAMQAVLTVLILSTLAFFAPWLIFGALAAVAIGGIILVLDDLWAGFTRGEGVFAGLFNEFQTLVDQNDSYVDATRLSLQTALDFWIHYFTGVENGSWRMGEAIRGAFRWMGDAIVAAWDATIEAILNGLIEIVGFFSDKLEPVINAVFGTLLRMVGVVSDLGLGDIIGTLGLGGPTSIAAPGSPAAGGNVNANQEININVNAPGGDGPAIAAAVGPAAGRAVAEGNRRTAQQLLTGGATP